MITTRFPPHFAGAAVQAATLSAQLLKENVSVEILTDHDHRKSVKDIYNGVPVHRLRTFLNGSSKWKEFIYVSRLFFFVFLHPRFHILHFHSMRGFEAFLFPVFKLVGKKILYKMTLCDEDDPLSFRQRKKLGILYAWGLSYVDQFVAISTRLQEMAVKGGVSTQKIRIVYNGVDPHRFRRPSETEKSKLRKRWEIDEDRIVYVSIGKIEYRKGFDFLLKAWKWIQQTQPSATLLIAGPGNDSSNSYYVSLMDMIRRERLRNIFFLGQIERTEECIQASDCFLFCSRSEGLGTVLIEAMASSVPVVSTNIAGVTEDILQDPRNGKICYSTKPEDFAELALNTVQDRDISQLDQAAQSIHARFGIETIARTYINLYENLLNDPTTPVQAPALP